MSASQVRAPQAAVSRTSAIGLLGGTFDPVHVGHLAVATAVENHFRLDRLYFIPSSRPPHKPKSELAPFLHRYAMVALACTDHPKFLLSLAESDSDRDVRTVFYSVDTVKYFKQRLRRQGDRLYFIVGVDAFLELPTWKNYEALLESCDFIVASRPGFRLDMLQLVIPPELMARRPSKDPNTIALRRTVVHLLPAVSCDVSSTEIRQRIARELPIGGLVPANVEEYILKQALYR